MSSNGEAKISQDTTAAKLNWWKLRIEIISPVASVVISLLAFVLALVALYLQIKGKLR